MFKAIILAAVLALAVAAPAPGVVTSYSGVVSPVAAAYSVPAISTYGASPVVAGYGSYGVQQVGYPAYGYGYGAPVAYY